MENHHSETPNSDLETSQSFTPPRHWIGPEELDEAYWKNPQVQEKRAQEFFEKPVEWVEKIEKIDQGGVARRDFLTLMGASMAMAGFACARRPVHKIIPYVVKPEEITPGVPNWYASTCQECSTGCGILVKDREGRPIKIEGNPDHPMNQGSLCARGQASLLNLYDPDRLKQPLKRTGRQGPFQESHWSEVDTAIQSKLRTLAGQGGRIRVLSDEVQSPTTRKLVREFLAPFKDSAHIEFDPLEFEEIRDSQEAAYGTAVIPHYRFEEAEVVVSLGADFLGGWLSPVEYSRAWAKNRKLSSQSPKNAKMSRLVSFESTMSLTGANADERYVIRPGDEYKIALALAYELIVAQKLSRFAGDGHVVSVLSNYRSDRIAKELGISGGVSTLKKIAESLWNHRGKSLVIGGNLQTKLESSPSLQLGINLLNSALENEGNTIDGTLNTGSLRSNYASVSRLVKEMNQGQVDALIIYRSNPLYTLSTSDLDFRKALKKVPLVILVSDRANETASEADFVLPDHHPLENWGDAQPRKSLYSLQQPVIAPMHSTRAFQDSLITWSKGMALAPNGVLARVSDWHDYLKTSWKENQFRESGSPASFDGFWEGVLRVGVLNLESKKGTQKPSARSFRSHVLSQIPTNYTQAKGIQLALYAKTSMHDGRSANNAWLQELPDPITTATWDNYLNLSPILAKKLGIKNDDVIRVQVGNQSVELPALVQPGMHPEVVSAAIGYGREAVGKVGNGAGVDVFPLVKVKDGNLVFSGMEASLQKTGRFYRLALTQWHHVTENRPIINDISLDEFRKDPGMSSHTDPHLRMEEVPTMWPKHEYPGYRWGMAIDLNSCTGCGACVVACQAENNIPVVGRDQVRVSRQMHWIKIDRYYSGSPESPEVVFQPMLCQHCENAPCETVCPVLATVHDSEGLNVQVYNRCVGTRYCQNNCPYKVRRFNYFDHWKAYEGPMNLAWNPEVTVRTRGIMEKCTFCTQRIRDAKDHAKDLGRKIQPGELVTACQQTCPTEAITFGDINDPNSPVSKMKDSPQAYRVLEILNTKPAVSYMTKVRNRAPAGHGSDHGASHAE